MRLDGLNEDEAWDTRIDADVEGRTIHIIGRDQLVKNKIAAGRPKDIADVARLKNKRLEP